jgi:hypothetical protein
MTAREVLKRVERAYEPSFLSFESVTSDLEIKPPIEPSITVRAEPGGFGDSIMHDTRMGPAKGF